MAARRHRIWSERPTLALEAGRSNSISVIRGLSEKCREMARILCVDTEPETIAALVQRGHSVAIAEMGYRTGVRDVATPPWDVEAIICDLRRPTYFDRGHWGPGTGNDNFQFVPVTQVTDERIYYTSGESMPRYQLPSDWQIEGRHGERRPSGTFGPEDVLRAISTAGVPFILFLNPEWIAHIAQRSPNFFGVSWKFKSTTAYRVETCDEFCRIVPEANGGPLSWQQPLQFTFASDGQLESSSQTPVNLREIYEWPLVTNAVGDRFGIVMRLSRGRVWLLPPCADNAALADIMTNRLRDLQAMPFIHTPGASAPPLHRAEEALLGTAAGMADDPTLPQPTVAADLAREFLLRTDEIELNRFRVVGRYVRYDDAVRQELKDLRDKLARAVQSPGGTRENYLLWAPPGTGKTFFVDEVAAAANGAEYIILNLAKCTADEFHRTLEKAANLVLTLCLVDEIDAKADESWPYEMLLPYLDASVDHRARLVFVLAGSSSTSLEEFSKGIAARPKGGDLLSRIPNDHRYTIPPLDVGDRALVFLQQLQIAASDEHHHIAEVEKMALYFVLQQPRLVSARQLREVAVRALRRTASIDDRLMYEHLFDAGDRANQDFYKSVDTTGLSKKFVHLEGPSISTPPTAAAARQGAHAATDHPRPTRTPAQPTAGDEARVAPRSQPETPSLILERLRLARASAEISYALQSNANDRTYMVTGAAIRRTQPSDRWTTEEARLLSQAIYQSVSSRRVDVKRSAATVLAESKDVDQDLFIRISVSASGIVVFNVGWREEPFPVAAVIGGLSAGLAMLLRKEFLEVFAPAAPMNVTLGLVNWPAAGLTAGNMWGVAKPRPIGSLKGLRVTHKFSLPMSADPWTILRPFLAYALGDGGFENYEPYIETKRPYKEIIDFCTASGLVYE